MNRKILYLQYTNPAGYPPLEHSSRILADAGWRVLFVGTGAYGADKLQFSEHPNIRVEKLPFCNAGWRQKFHYLWFCFWAIGWTIGWRPQWIYASDVTSCPAGLLLSCFSRMKVIYHEHDSPENPPQNFWIKFCLWTRKKLSTRAKLCILPNEKRIERFSSIMKKKVNTICVWNCPSLEEISPPRTSHDEKSLKVLYHGSIVPARLPISVIEALALLPKHVRLSIVGYETVGSHGYIKKLQEIALKYGLGDQIEFISVFVTRESLIEYCRSCDVGLALVPREGNDLNEQTMVGASNKPFDYLANGLPILVPDISDWKEFFVEPGYGLSCDPNDPKSIARPLQWFLNHPKEMREMGERGRQRILKEWNYEQQFAPVLKQLLSRR